MEEEQLRTLKRSDQEKEEPRGVESQTSRGKRCCTSYSPNCKPSPNPHFLESTFFSLELLFLECGFKRLGSKGKCPKWENFSVKGGAGQVSVNKFRSELIVSAFALEARLSWGPGHPHACGRLRTECSLWQNLKAEEGLVCNPSIPFPQGCFRQNNRPQYLCFSITHTFPNPWALKPNGTKG